MKRDKTRSLASNAILLTIITLVSKLTGFFREYALAVGFGTSFEADAYTIALNVPVVLFATLLTAAVNCYTPQYNTICQKSGKEKGDIFTSGIVTIFNAVALFSAILIMAFPEAAVRIFSSGFHGETYALTVKLVRMTATMMLFMPCSQFFSSYLRSNESPLVPAANNIVYNILLSIAFLFSVQLGITGITVFGSALYVTQILVQTPALKAKGYKYRPTFIFDDDIKYMLKLLAPVLVSTAVLEINTLIDRSMASNLAEGSISSLNYAKKLTDFIFGIISVSLSAIIYPKLALLAAKNDKNRFSRLLENAMQAVSVLTIPILVFTMMFSNEAVKIIYGRGNFSAYAVGMTASALFYYSVGMVFNGFRDLLTKAFYALHDTKTAMKNSIIATAANILLNIILVRFLQHGGLALASSIAMSITTVLLLNNLNKKISINIKAVLCDSLKSLCVSVVLCFAAKIIYNFAAPLNLWTSLGVLLIEVCVLCVLYVIICSFLQVSLVRTRLTSLHI